MVRQVRSRWSVVRRWLPFGVSAGVGLLVAITVGLVVHELEQAKLRTDFLRHADAQVNAIRNELATHLEPIDSIASVPALTNASSRQAFRAFVAPILSRRPGSRCYEYLSSVSRGQINVFEEHSVRDGLPSVDLSGFRITQRTASGELAPAGIRSSYAAIYSQEPMMDDGALLGFDRASDPAMSAALQRAQTTGTTSATPRFAFETDSDGQRFGVWFVHPVQRSSVETDPPRTRAGPKGYVALCLDVGAVVETALKRLPPLGIDLTCYDQSAAAGERLLAFHPSRSRGATAPNPPGNGVERSGLHSTAQIAVAGREWAIVAEPAPKFFAAYQSGYPWLLSTAVLLVSLLSGGWLQHTSNRRTETERTVVERERAIAALRDSEELLKSVVASAPVVIHAVDRNGAIRLFDGTGLAAVGLEPGRFVGQNYFDVWKDHPNLTDSVQRCLHGAIPPTTTTMVGATTYESRFSPLRSADGTVTGALSVCVDVSQRVRADQALRESESKYRTLFEDSRDAIFVSDNDGAIIDANPAALDLFGLDHEDIGRIDFTNLYADPAVRDRSIETIGREGAQAGLEMEMRRKDGSTFDAVITASVRHDEQRDVVGYQGIIRNVTERKRADRALRERDERFRALTENSAVAFWHITVSRDTIDANLAMCDLLEIDDPKELAGRKANEFLAPEYAESVDEQVAMRRRGKASTYEVVLVGQRGTRRHVILSAAPITDSDGAVQSMVALYIDITERKQAEERHRRLSEVLMSLWKTDVLEQGGFSDTVREITRIAAQALQVGRVSVWLFEEDRSRIRCLDLFELAAGRHSEGQIIELASYPAYSRALQECREIAVDDARTDPRTIEFLNDRLIPFGITSKLDAPIRIDEGGIGILCITQVGTLRHWSLEDRMFAGSLADIVAIAAQSDQRQRAEEALAESRRFSDRIIEASPLSVYVFDIDAQRVDYVNREIERDLGYSSDQIEGMRSVGITALLHPDDQEHLSERLSRWESAEDGQVFENEYRMKHADGSWRSFIGRDTIFSRTPDGRVSQVIGTAQDVTEYKRLEQQLLQSQKLEAIGRLAGGVAHDFNNVLTIVLGYGEIVLGSLPTEDPNWEMVERMVEAGKRAATLTRQLLAFSRKQVFEPVVIDLNAVVGQVEKMLVRLIGADVQLTLRQDPSLGRVKSDPGQIEQILMNLAVNARDAMPTGGRLVIETRNVEIDAAYAASHAEAREGIYSMLAVTDTGCGFDATTRARMFEPFFTTKELGQGSGLGLATVFGIVKQSGGYIEVYGEHGHGAAFKVYLPHAEEGEPVSTPNASESSASLYGDETVLLVDDDDRVRSLARAALEKWGYRIIEATNGAEALRMGGEREGPLHLLVTDVIMPKMSGPQIAQRLETFRPDVKVLFMSGYTDDALQRHGVTGREVAFIQKPFTLTGLARKVRDLLDASIEAGRSGADGTEAPGQVGGG